VMSTDALETIDHTSLHTVTGGLEVDHDDIQVRPRPDTARPPPRRSRYEACVDAVTSRPGWQARHVLLACGRAPQ